MESKLKNGANISPGKNQMKNKTYRKLYNKFNSLKEESSKYGISDMIFGAILKGQDVEILENGSRKIILDNKLVIGISALFFVVSVLLGVAFKNLEIDQEIKYALFGSRCFVDNSEFFMEVARPRFACEMCRDLKEVPIKYNITTDEFVAKYAYCSVPVLIKDATKGWSAMETFNFHYFKKLYSKFQVTVKEKACQFFQFNTEFDTLEEVFNMSDARANFLEGELPWYIGRSNCHRYIATELRKHYIRPYFLPNDSESSTEDWIFMGGPGHGAHFHLDYVKRPSWQAQISGKKTWTLIPTPECENVCRTMNVTVHKGDIIIIDTNNWYHATYIHPGEISITIGSEYD